MTTSWLTTLDAVDHRTLPPDPDVLAAIGLNHSLKSAIADLVDNSIDAGAANVLVRFVQNSGQLISLLVIDDGIGMDDKDIDRAMTVGARRAHPGADLGHFGMGLKAASFSQADALIVLSQAEGHSAVGRRWIRDSTRSFECDVIDPDQAETILSSHCHVMVDRHGTVVRWDQVRAFPASRNPSVTEDYLTRAVQEIRAHLGLVLHRLLQKAQLTVRIDVLNVAVGESGAPQFVEPIDPFSYRHTGHAGYPKAFEVRIGDSRLAVDCHIWPARSESLGFRLNSPAERNQGFYFYRNDRLLQSGDWKGATVPHRRLQLARVAVDISSHLDLFEMSMEKNSVQPRSEFVRAVERSAAKDGTDFARYLTDAEETYRLGNRRSSGRQDVVPPGVGLPPEVKRAAAQELGFIDGRDPVAIRWKALGGHDFFEIDRASQTLWLNSKYRQGLLGGRRGSLNDLPVVKALMYLLTEDVFRGLSYGPRDKDNVEIWQAMLTAAAEVECDDK